MVAQGEIEALDGWVIADPALVKGSFFFKDVSLSDNTQANAQPRD
jgi:hypothetical protein